MEELKAIANFKIFSCPHCNKQSAIVQEKIKTNATKREYKLLAKEQKQEILALKQEGVRTTEIAQKYNIAPSRVYNIISRLRSK